MRSRRARGPVLPISRMDTRASAAPPKRGPRKSELIRDVEVRMENVLLVLLEGQNKPEGARICKRYSQIVIARDPLRPVCWAIDKMRTNIDSRAHAA